MRTVIAGLVVVGNLIVFHVVGAAVDLAGASLVPIGIPQSAKGWSQCTIFSSFFRLCFLLHLFSLGTRGALLFFLIDSTTDL